MIFVTVGSQKFQFNRLLIEIDRLVKKGDIKPEDVFAQIGYSTYQPKFFAHKKFLNNDEYIEKIKNSNIIVTHGGTGSIINGIKSDKKVIGIPRMREFLEHVDNHQVEIIEQFTNSGLISSVSNIEELGLAISELSEKKFKKYESNTKTILNIIEEFLDSKI